MTTASFHTSTIYFFSTNRDIIDFMRLHLVLVGFAAMIVLTGCGMSTAKNSREPDRTVIVPKDLTISKSAYASQRFIPTSSPDLAFDTKTGSLCKTWNWADSDNYSENHNLSAASTCERLYDEDLREERAQRIELWQHERETAKAKP